MNGGKTDLTDYGKSLPSLQEIQLQLHALTSNPVDIVVNEDVTVRAECKTKELINIDIEFNVLEYKRRPDHYMYSDSNNCIVTGHPNIYFYFSAYCSDTRDWIKSRCYCKNIHKLTTADIPVDLTMEITIPNSNLKKLIFTKEKSNYFHVYPINQENSSWAGGFDCDVEDWAPDFIPPYGDYLLDKFDKNEKVYMNVKIF